MIHSEWGVFRSHGTRTYEMGDIVVAMFRKYHLLQHLSNASHLPDTVLNILHTLSLNLLKNPFSYYYYFHLIDKENEAQRG